MKRRLMLLLTTVAFLLTGVAHAQEDVPVLVSTEWLAEHLDDENIVIVIEVLDQPSGSRGHSRLAEPVHDARRTRPLRRGDGGCCEKRVAGIVLWCLGVSVFWLKNTNT